MHLTSVPVFSHFPPTVTVSICAFEVYIAVVTQSTVAVSVALCCCCFVVEIYFLSYLTAPELQCDFEHGLCSWKQEQGGADMFDWTRIQGPTPTFHTGPWKDHTLGTSYGHYLYMESSRPQEFKDTAVLLSRVFQPTYQRRQDLSTSQHHCVFRFHYNMYGSHVFCLAVYLRTTATGRGQMLWVQYGHQGNLWHRKTLYLNSARPFQVNNPRTQCYVPETDRK